jgi:hypothetical protein
MQPSQDRDPVDLDLELSLSQRFAADPDAPQGDNDLKRLAKGMLLIFVGSLVCVGVLTLAMILSVAAALGGLLNLLQSLHK